MFVFSPELLMIDTTWTYLIWMVFTAVAGMTLIGAGIIGYWIRQMYWYERIFGIIGGLLLIYPEGISDMVGLGLFILLFALQFTKKKHDKGNPLATNA
jgi:TRAP-type uncharacterized transport system fused permease subunit